MKRKILHMILALCMVATLLPVTSISARADSAETDTMTKLYTDVVTNGGDAPASGIYSIGSATELKYLADYVNGNRNTSGVTFYLTADIDLNEGVSFAFDADTGLVEVAKEGETTYWLGTGVAGDDSGSNETFDSTASTIGAIYNDKATNVTGTASFTPNEWTPIGDNSSSTYLYFCGTFDGNKHTVSGIYSKTNHDYQGLFGCVYRGTLENVGVVDSYISGQKAVGGVAGAISSSTVSYCYNAGAVSGSGDYAGGVAGSTACSTVSYCYNSGAVSGSGDYVGGAVGYNYSSTVSYCYNTGTVSGSGDDVGGVTGVNVGTPYGIGTVSDCYNAGAVFGSARYVGGVAGLNVGLYGSSTVSYCYNTGAVSSSVNYVGGVVGSNTVYASESTSTVSYCYNAGAVSGSGDYVGGVAGNSNTTLYCYYDQQMCTYQGINNGDATDQAEGMPTSKMIGTERRTVTSGEGWTDEHWTFEDGLYPRLADPSGENFDMDTSPAAYVSAVPLFLSYTSDSDYETTVTVASALKVSIYNGVTWYDNHGAEIMDNSTLAVTTDGITIAAEKNGIVKKLFLKTMLSGGRSVPVETLSNGATLAGLSISSGTLSPGFNSGTTAYAASVSNSAGSITVTPTVKEAYATVTVNGTDVASGIASEPISLSVGENTITILVTAQDGIITNTYTIAVTRAASSGGGNSASPHYTITATAGDGGHISPSGSTAVAYGYDKTYAMIPDDGYEIKDVLADGVSVGAITTYTFSDVSKSHTIKAVFQKKITVWQNPYSDIHKDAWCYNAVRFVSEKGLMQGNGEKFNPDGGVTRGMFVTVLYRLSGDTGSYTTDFTDVPSGKWCENAVAWAAQNGIADGVGNARFAPDNGITRQQIAVLLYNYAKYKGYDVSIGKDTNILSYEDALTISDYAYPALQWVCGAGIINGNNQHLNPNAPATRAQVAAMLERFIENVTGKVFPV